MRQEAYSIVFQFYYQTGNPYINTFLQSISMAYYRTSLSALNSQITQNTIGRVPVHLHDTPANTDTHNLNSTPPPCLFSLSLSFKLTPYAETFFINMNFTIHLTVIVFYLYNLLIKVFI